MGVYLYTARKKSKEHTLADGSVVTVNNLEYSMKLGGGLDGLEERKVNKAHERFPNGVTHVTCGGMSHYGGFIHERSNPVWYDTDKLGPIVGWMAPKRTSSDNKKSLLKSFVNYFAWNHADINPGDLRIHEVTEGPFKGMRTVHHFNTQMDYNYSSFLPLGVEISLPFTSYDRFSEMNHECRSYKLPDGVIYDILANTVTRQKEQQKRVEDELKRRQLREEQKKKERRFEIDKRLRELREQKEKIVKEIQELNRETLGI
jgi:hypothetical protein